MRKIKFSLIVLMVLVSSPLPVFANQAGGDTYAFLRLGAGARAQGLGGAFVALADDATSVYWNPAGLTQIPAKEAFLMSSFGGKSELTSKYYYLGMIIPVDFVARSSESVGFSLINFGIDKIEKTTTDNYGNLVRNGDFNDAENAFIISYAREIFSEIFSIGGNLKYITHSFDAHSGKGLGVDIGFLADISSIFEKKDKPVLWVIRDAKMGLCIKSNFAKKWETGSKDNGSVSGELGVSFNTTSKENEDALCWLWACSLEQGKGRPIIAHLGTELQFYEKIFALRAGISNWYLENRYQQLEIEKLNYNRNASIGLGAKLNMYQIDYAILFSRFGTKHQISTSLKF